MIYSNRSKLLFLAIIFLLISCGGDGGGEVETPVGDPQSASLSFPLNNSECTVGTILSDTQSQITFEWSAAVNAEKYTLVVTNLNDDTSRNIHTNDTEKEVTLERGVAFSWYVISKSNATSTTANSSTWQFYNAGLATENYAPFPAGLISPIMGSTTNTTLNLSWSGSDVDNDIIDYEVYLDTSNPPSLLQETTSNTTISVSGLNSATVYYWQVVTNDDHGNNSLSPVFEFRTQ